MLREELRRSPIGNQDSFYKEYCLNTDKIWEAIKQAKTIEDFLILNRMYKKEVEFYSKRHLSFQMEVDS